jgi:hypothetical protein
VPQAGWAGISNGKLLALIAGNYDAFLTVDKNLPAQQKTAALSFGVVVLRAPSNQLAELRPLVPQILTALTALHPGSVVVVTGAQARAAFLENLRLYILPPAAEAGADLG